MMLPTKQGREKLQTPAPGVWLCSVGRLREHIPLVTDGGDRRHSPKAGAGAGSTGKHQAAAQGPVGQRGGFLCVNVPL